MKKGIIVVLTVAILAVLGLGVMGFTAAQSGELVNTTQQVGIWVSGEGKVTVVPDVANLSLGVQVEAATLADANSKASAAMDALINVLKTQGIADKDIKTQNFSIYPVYDYTKDIGTQVIRGYQVTNTVAVKVRVIANSGKIIDASVTAAGDAVRVNSISFSVDDPTKSIDQARELALLDAKAKAEQIARVTGVSLGSVSFVSDSSSNVARIVAPSFDAKAGAAGSTTPILPGDTDLTVSVQVIYNIK